MDISEKEIDFFKFIRECGKLLNKSNDDTAKLVEDNSWFYCFDDGLSPQQAVDEYLKQNKESLEKE